MTKRPFWTLLAAILFFEFPSQDYFAYQKAKTLTLRIRINDNDLKLFTKAAQASGQNLSAWIRATLR